MTREEQIDWLCRLRADLNNGVIFTPWNKEFTEALNDVLEKEPTTKNLAADREDAVERLNAIKQLIGYDKDSEIVKATQKSLNMAIKALEQESRKGHWIFDGDCLICSKCKKAYSFSGSNFCPNCGADMRGEE